MDTSTSPTLPPTVPPARPEFEPQGQSRHFYLVIAGELKARIEAGEFPVGGRLPSTSALCTQYRASTITVRAALKELVAAGYAESRPRSGFFVCDWQHASRPGGDLISLLVESVRSPFFTECIAGVEEICRAAGYHMLVADSHGIPALEAEQLHNLAPQVAGFIIMPVDPDGNYSAYLPLMERKTPFVFIDRYMEQLSAPSVTTDNELGGYLAACHLLDCGRRQIFALGVRDSTSQRERLRGYERALRERGVTPNAAWVRRTLLQNEEAGYELTRDLLREFRPRQPFGIFAVHDNVARGSLIALKEAGLHIPGDAAVVGFDDISAVFFDPPLSSVRQDMRAMGRRAAQLLLDAMSGEKNLPSVRLAPELVVRNSTDAASDFCLTQHITRGARRSAPATHSAFVAA